MTRAFAIAAALALAACSEDPVRVASKNFTENQILAEMFALLIEDAGIPVDRRIPLGDTATVFESLRTGATDIYPEYTGTGLALLGIPPADETGSARDRVADELDRLGISVLEPLGFESAYSVFAEPGLARELDLDDVADLAEVAPELRIAVAEGFAERSRDGLQALLDRFGLDFEAIEVVPEDQRRSVYDRLLDDRADLAVGFGTDPEVAAYGLETLDLGDDFAVSYEAVPIVATAALARHPEIRGALEALGGEIDTGTMRRLNGAVALDGRAPGEVAREALAELGLVEPGARVEAGPYRIAVQPADIGTPMANAVLRAARLAVEKRGVALVGSPAPANAIFDRAARVALAPSIAQFEITEQGAAPREDLEAIAAVGSYLVHAVAAPDGPGTLDDAARIAAGPRGSSSHALAEAIAGRSDPAGAVVVLESGGADAIADALREGVADAGILLAPAGRIDVAEALDAGGVRLIPADDWWTGAARVAYPFLGTATIPAGAYDDDPVPTLSMQAVVFGPAPRSAALGQQGPSTYSEAPSPVTDRVVLAFNENLGPHPDVGYALRRSAALVPDMEGGQRALNRTPGYTALSLGIVLFLAWATWLLLRPDTQRRSG